MLRTEWWLRSKGGNRVSFQAGREMLIKAITQAIPAYLMNIFCFLDNLCNEIDAAIANFWWGQKGGERKIYWISRHALGMPKQEGGMGFRDLKTFNLSLLAKQGWRLLLDPDSLWARVMKGRYFPNCSLLDAKKWGKASWAWSSLPVSRDVIAMNSH